MNRRITPQTTLDNLRKEAKRWLKALRAGEPEARARLSAALPKAPAESVLRDVQHALAREYGFSGWNQLRAALPENQPTRKSSPAEYEQLARDLVTVYAADDSGAMQRINRHFSASYAPDDIRALVWRLMYKVRRAKGDAKAFQVPEAQEFVSRVSGFPSWQALTEAAAANAPPPGPAYAIDRKENRLGLRRIPAAADWDTIIGVLKEHRIPALEARMMTDGALRRIAELDFVTSLSLGGSRGLSDEGMQALAHMPQLEHLELSEYPGGNLTDRSLEILRHLPNLRKFEMTWQKGITDAGVANLRYCEQLEEVNLMGSPTGDGAIEALRGKPKLRRFSSGRLVTDAGLALLPEIPLLRRWNGPTAGEIGGTEDLPTKLLIDGPFTDAGLASLARLEGVFELDLFWHVTAITADGFSYLTAMPNLMSLGCDGAITNDTSIRHIAAIPRLRMLRAQGSAATDDGFVALAQSGTLERFWGREAPHLTGRGFVAFSNMPRLNTLGISLARVDDQALSTLPRFPALRRLTPINMTDAGFRHVGRCERLLELSCMYCRETGDVATQHIAGLRLTKYYAGLTQITDHSLEILGRMDSLEVVELFETKKVTDAGVAHLAKLPRLRRIELSGLPHVTGTAVFPKTVQVEWNV